jgi:hypothetical protein
VSSSITLAGRRVVRARLLVPWRGVPIVDCELDTAGDVSGLPTSGPATLSIATPEPSSIVGTLDPRGTGTWGPKASARLVAGGGGWDQPVGRAQFHSRAGVASQSVYQTTASLVGEKVTDLAPIVFGADFVRMVGPASRVFGDRDWWVDLATGTTFVGTRAQATLAPSLTLADFDPLAMRVEIYGDTLVLPGTVLSDPRFNGATYTVRDVEHVFEASGGKATCLLAAANVSTLSEALACMVRQFADTAHLKTYRYRYVQASGGDLALQAITPNAPDLNPIAQWTGLSGALDTLAPSTIVVVGFTGDVPPQPYIASYQPGSIPINATLDATAKVTIGKTSAEVDIGPQAGLVKIGASATPLTPTPYSTALKAVLLAQAQAMALLTSAPLTPIGTIGSTMVSALNSLPSPSTTVLEGQ